MPIEIRMPALSPTMTEGNLARWLKKEGDEVHAGDVIAEIETDKATMEVEASDEGKLGKILVAEGTEGVKVNTPIAMLLGEGESEGATAPKATGQRARNALRSTGSYATFTARIARLSPSCILPRSRNEQSTGMSVTVSNNAPVNASITAIAIG